jgi:hypothetical protein
MPTRDFLREHGKTLVDHLHHEEYEYEGVVYVAGWASPRASENDPGGWFVYERDKPPFDSKPEELRAARAAQFEASDASKVRYFCGALYGPRESRAFDTVRASRASRPYVTNKENAMKLFGLCAHHSGLYRLEGEEAVRVEVGRVGLGLNEADMPARVKLTAEQVRQIESAELWLI